MRSIFQRAAIAALTLSILSAAIFTSVTSTFANSIPVATSNIAHPAAHSAHILAQKSSVSHLQDQRRDKTFLESDNQPQPEKNNKQVIYLPFTTRINTQSQPEPLPTVQPEPVTAQAEPIVQPGPGLGNLSYKANELFSPISIIESIPEDDDDPLGHGNAAMVNG